ncbi:MAG: hypothetical protein LBG87_03025 [Spirochaetaceae bacterium]|jgi:hypothetical protein|nr:hypothetical protein [Spirochaetaceae bacterium]
MLNKLGKLLKYEFKFYCRIMPIFYLALILVSAAAAFQGSFTLGFSYNRGITINLLIWGGLLTAMLTVNLALIVQRFRENFFKNPGYLMFTLPVSMHVLIASKAVAAFCSAVASLITGVIATGIAISLSGEGLFESITVNRTFVLMSAMLLTLIFQQICLIYSLMTASRILPRFQTPAAVIAYFAVNLFVHEPIQKAVSFGGDGVSAAALGTDIVFAVLYFWLAGFLLKRTLNLE